MEFLVLLGTYISSGSQVGTGSEKKRFSRDERVDSNITSSLVGPLVVPELADEE